MTDPNLKTVSLHNVLIELLSAQSSLNMPDPMHCSRQHVEHAYKHLEAALAMLTCIVVRMEEKEEHDLRRANGELHFDTNDWEITEEVHQELTQHIDGMFRGRLLTDELERVAKQVAETFIQDLHNRGDSRVRRIG